MQKWFSVAVYCHSFSGSECHLRMLTDGTMLYLNQWWVCLAHVWRFPVRSATQQMERQTQDLQESGSPEKPTVSVKDEVTSGDSVTATCTVLHSCPSDLPRVTWSHVGSHSSLSQPQSHDQWKVESYNLTFTPSSKDHDKNLSCSAEFRGKTVTGYKRLKVKYPPYDVKVVTKLPLKENDSAELTCSSNSNPPANSYQWFSLNGTLLGNGTTYNLENVSRHTEAISCTAINTVGRNSSGPQKMNVLYPPYDVKVVTKSSVRENDSAELTCSSDSNPPANNYQWFSLNGTLLGNGTTYKLEKVSRHTESISCTAINPFGKNSSSPRKLNILYPPEIKSESSCQGGILTVCVCIVDSNPPSEVKWFDQDFSKTFPSSNIKQNEYRTIITMQNWQGLPENVSCFANNSLGNSSITLAAPLNGITIYIAVGSTILVVFVGVLVYVVKRHRGNRATQQPVMKNEMKTIPESKEEKGFDEDIYTNCPDGGDYDNCRYVGTLSCNSALEDESIYANA
ncbi:B-cell receptor CD22-like [Pimephales promelas]|nr:B-cell receptor CD22-like [Pimephales promelas]